MIKSDGDLKEAIDGLYRTFSRYPLPPHVDGCRHCVSDSDHALLYAVALRDLSSGHLSRYAFKAMTTRGDEDDFRHFLPRIFELAIIDGESWTVPVVFGKLAYGRLETWPSDERQAITTFFEALWSNVLDHFPHAFSAEDCLCCIAQAVDDLLPYLARWHIAQSLTYAKHFASFLEYDLVGWPASRDIFIERDFWADHPKAARQVLQWLRQPDRATELEYASSHLASDEEDVALILQTARDLSRPCETGGAD
jgi:hypothetical protein